MRNPRRICSTIKGDTIVKEINFQIIVPFYNDFNNFKKFTEIIEESDIPDDTFLFLDNGSKDLQMNINLSNEVRPSKKWKLIRSESNLGYGGGIIFASKFIDKDFIGWMPGNMKINPIEAFNFAENISTLNKYTYVKARRINRPFFDSLKTKIFGIIASLHFNVYIYDAGGTPNIVHKDFFKISKYMPSDYSFDVFVYYYFKVNSYCIERPKIKYTKRLYGNSHWQRGILSEINLLLTILNYKKEWVKISKIKF